MLTNGFVLYIDSSTWSLMFVIIIAVVPMLYFGIKTFLGEINRCILLDYIYT